MDLEEVSITRRMDDEAMPSRNREEKSPASSRWRRSRSFSDSLEFRFFYTSDGEHGDLPGANGEVLESK